MTFSHHSQHTMHQGTAARSDDGQEVDAALTVHVATTLRCTLTQHATGQRCRKIVCPLTCPLLALHFVLQGIVLHRQREFGCCLDARSSHSWQPPPPAWSMFSQSASSLAQIQQYKPSSSSLLACFELALWLLRAKAPPADSALKCVTSGFG
jgi:hypothetical protein